MDEKLHECMYNLYMYNVAKKEEMEYMYTIFTLQKKYMCMYMYMCSDIESILESVYIDKMCIKQFWNMYTVTNYYLFCIE